MTLEVLLRQYLNLYWLRPDTAIWRTLDALELSKLEFRSPVADLGCGDGTNAHILMGGTFDPSFDVFLATATLTPEQFFAGKHDIYDSEAPAPELMPQVSPPPRHIDIGLDWKPASLRRAATLGVYLHTVCQDLNEPLPFADSTFNTIFSNAAYWIERLDAFLAELARVVARDGRIHLILPNDNIKQYYVYDLYLKYGWDWCKNLDMGRYFHIKHFYSRPEWCEMFHTAGLAVSSWRPYLSHRVIQLSELGLRPLSPVLIKMVNRLKPEDRVSIKTEWVEYCYRLALPLFASGWIFEGEPTYHMFELARA
jgi:SAM-dependent methyltransferase